MKEGHHKTPCSLGGLTKDYMELEKMMVGAFQMSGDLMRIVTTFLRIMLS